MAKRRSGDVLTTRALGRATLGRQLLLERAAMKPLDAIERLVGLQAQLARPPFIALWTRLARFERDELTSLAEKKRVVRGTMMRHTIHLASARDFLALRPTLQPALDKALRGALKDRAGGFDLDALAREARALFDEEPRTFEGLRSALVKSHPQADERALGYAVRTRLPFVFVPDGGAWGWPANANAAAAETFLGKPLAAAPDPRALVLRYLAAFGPATPADAQTWSGLPSLKPVFEELRPRLRAFTDEAGRELFDLDDAPRPPEDTPAPLRFLPEFDNAIMAHADRSRIVDDAARARINTKNLVVPATFLVDGRVAGMWSIARKKAAVLSIEPFAPLAKKQQAELVAEADRLLRFVEPEAASYDVRLTPPRS